MTDPMPTAAEAGGARPIVSAMRARSAHEPHRTATPLELLFDLVFVVAIAQAASGLHHAIAEQHAADGLLGYAMVFFAIWWAWMNFTWFASAYDCDDVPYRILVFMQITGALVMAAGVPAFFEQRNANIATIGGYAIMRAAMVTQWLRAGAADVERRPTAYRYAGGIATLQVAWIALVFMPRAIFLPFWALLCALELAVPVWAERVRPTTWHPHHIAERYGLLTLIVLGELILAAMTAVQSALATGSAFSSLLPVIIGGLLIVFSMWWMYFDRPVHDLLTSLRTAIVWGYGHYIIFASAAAVGAGLGVAVDDVTHHAKVGAFGAGAAVAVPVAVYLLCLWFLHDRPEYRPTRAYGPVAASLVLLSPFTGQAVLTTGIILATLIAAKLVVLRPPPARSPIADR
jgi:low temperature requirement protein LtrA